MPEIGAWNAQSIDIKTRHGRSEPAVREAFSWRVNCDRTYSTSISAMASTADDKKGQF